MLAILDQLWKAVGQAFTYYTLHDFVIVLGLLAVDFMLVFSTRRRFQSKSEQRILYLLWGLIPILTVIGFETYLIMMNGGEFVLSQTDLQLVILYYFLIMLENHTQIVFEVILAIALFVYFAMQMPLNDIQITFGIIGIVLITLSTWYVNNNTEKVLSNMIIYLIWLIIWSGSWWLVLFLGIHDGNIYSYLALVIKFIILMTVVHYLNRFVRAALDRYLKIENAAQKDYLTGMLNRESFNQVSEKSFQLFQLNRKTFSLIMFDIDNFKLFNDSYGHTIGDHVLQSVTQQAQKVLSISELDGQIYRLGGEEFGILVQSSDIDKIKDLAQKIAQEVKNNPLDNGGKALKITISMGITEIRIGDEEFNDVYQRADDALYYSKKNGKSAITIGQNLIKV